MLMITMAMSDNDDNDDDNNITMMETAMKIMTQDTKWTEDAIFAPPLLSSDAVVAAVAAVAVVVI